MYDYRERVNQGNRNNGYYTKRGNYLMYQADEKRYDYLNQRSDELRRIMKKYGPEHISS